MCSLSGTSSLIRTQQYIFAVPFFFSFFFFALKVFVPQLLFLGSVARTGGYNNEAQSLCVTEDVSQEILCSSASCWPILLESPYKGNAACARW